MKLLYTPRAADELERILGYLAQQSPSGARRVRTRVQTLIEMLRQQPDLGRRTSNGRLRRVVATPYPYLIFYEATEDEIIIAGVRHGRRSPRTMPADSDTVIGASRPQ